MALKTSTKILLIELPALPCFGGNLPRLKQSYIEVDRRLCFQYPLQPVEGVGRNTKTGGIITVKIKSSIIQMY